MTLNLEDILRLIHPFLAVTFVFPLIGITVYMAWQTRQRRLTEGKSKIPPSVGPEHLKVGRWLTAAVVGITLVGCARPIANNIVKKQLLAQQPFQVVFIILMFAVTIASLVLLYRARPALWRGVFATLCGMGVVIIGFQDGVYRRDNEWFVSHFYIGMGAALLIIFALAIAPDIYQDRSQTWRKIHIGLNCIALLLFLGQGFTGARDLLEIPLGWQEPAIYQCDFQNKKCGGGQSQAPHLEPALTAQAGLSQP